VRQSVNRRVSTQHLQNGGCRFVRPSGGKPGCPPRILVVRLRNPDTSAKNDRRIRSCLAAAPATP